MQYAALAVILAAVVAGVVATHRFVPPLGDHAPGRTAFWVVSLLVGASAGVIADALWVAVRSLTSANFASLSGAAESVVTVTAHGVLLDGGGLLALASLVYFLARRATDGPAN